MAMSATIALVAYATVFMAPFQHNSEIYIVGFYGIFSLVLAGLIAGYAVVALVYALGLGVLMAVAERNRRLVEASASRAAEERGSGAIAKEIRRLADDTAVNAKKVADPLGAVAAAIGQAVATNEEAAEAYALVRAEIDKVAGAISEIAQGVSELSSGTDEINKGTTLSVNVTQSVVEAADRVGEVERGVRAQESAAKAIGEAISQTAARLDGLADEASKVKLAGAKTHETLGELGRRLAGLGRRDGHQRQISAPTRLRPAPLGAGPFAERARQA